MATRVYRSENFSGTQQRWYWDDVAKQPGLSPLSGSFSPGLVLSSPANTVIDVYQKTPSQVVLVYFNNGFSSGNGQGYPKHYLNEIVIAGAGGDTNTVLLYSKCNSSPDSLEFAVYSLITKEVSIFTYPKPKDYIQTPYCITYSKPGDEIIQQTCIGTTLRRIYYDGVDDVTVEDTENSAICGYVAPIPEVQITEVKTIKIDHSCSSNPVYLVWKNTLGGWDHWLFKKTQTKNIITESTGQFTKPVYSLNTDTVNESLGSNVYPSMVLGADGLTKNQKHAISELLYSPKVYIVNKDGSKMTVIPRPGSFLLEETENKLHSIEFEIELPEIFTIKN